MSKSCKNGFEINIILCKYFDTPRLLKGTDILIKKYLLENNCIDYTFLVRIVQTEIINQELAVVLIKFGDNQYRNYTSFKIITEILLNPKDNYERFKAGLFEGQEVAENFEKVLKEEGSIKQYLFFARHKEEMQGCGYYSLIVSSRSAQTLRENPNNILDDIVDEYRFEVVESGCEKE